MSREITNTASRFENQDLPDGRNCFRVLGVEKKYGKKGGEFFVWKLQHAKGTGEQVMLPNMMGGLLRVLGCDEVEPNKFDWDTMEQTDKLFMATVSHKPDKENPSTIRQHMGTFDEYKDAQVPF